MSTWFRDYVYIPMGGNRCGKFRRNVNLLATFIISGLWHGANWTFIVWGTVHGLAQIVENAFVPKGYQPHGVMRAVRTLGTFVFVMLAWVVFRANSIAEAGYVFSHMFSGITGHLRYIKQGFHYIGINKAALASIVVMLSALAIHDWPGEIPVLRSRNFQRLAYVLLVLVIILFSPKGVATEFVYFQF